MSDDCLKLTTYFGERDRVAGRLVGDALLDIYGAHAVAASVLLRGTEGFGRRHRRRTDQLLTLSEDLPVVSVAIDRHERIEAITPQVLEVQQRGLITLERARRLTGGLASVTAPEQPEHPDEAAKLTIYVGRQERAAGRTAYVEVCDLLHRGGVAGATVLLGVDGTRHGERRRARFFARNGDVPMMIIAVGSGERIAATVPRLAAGLSDPLMTLERVRVCKRDGHLLARPEAVADPDEQGRAVWQKLMIYTSQSATVAGRPINVEIARRLRGSDAAGVTCLRGIWGFHGDHEPHGDRLAQVRRRVPVVTIAIDTPRRIARAFDIVDELTADEGLVTSELVPTQVRG